MVIENIKCFPITEDDKSWVPKIVKERSIPGTKPWISVQEELRAVQETNRLKLRERNQILRLVLSSRSGEQPVYTGKIGELLQFSFAKINTMGVMSETQP